MYVRHVVQYVTSILITSLFFRGFNNQNINYILFSKRKTFHNFPLTNMVSISPGRILKYYKKLNLDTDTFFTEERLTLQDFRKTENCRKGLLQ